MSMRYYLILFLCHLVHSVCYPDEETLVQCLNRKKKKKESEQEILQDDFARHSGLGKACIKLN